MAIKVHSSLAVHAGDWLKTEIVEAYGLKVAHVANKLGVSRQAMSGLLNGNVGLSAEMAIRFEKAFGVRADTLLRMQASYDLARARAHEADIKVERVAVAA